MHERFPSPLRREPDSQLSADSDRRPGMTPDELTATLDAMLQAAGGNPDLLPGLIEVNSTEWCEALYVIERTAKTLDEGIRHRNVKVAVSSLFTTRALTRAEAGERGAPYRDLAAAS